MAVGVLKVIKS